MNDRAALQRQQKAALRAVAQPRTHTTAAAGARGAQAQARGAEENGANVAIWGVGTWGVHTWGPRR